IVVRALEDEGIPYTFGIPGTHNIELYDALAQSDKVRPVLVTDEQSASFMADGFWRASGKLGCANLVPGAGLTHAMSGIAEAFLDNVPMLVLGCGIRRDTQHAFQLHDVDQSALAAPVTKAQVRPENGEQLYQMIRRACAIARAGAPGPVFVEVPANLYLLQQETQLGYNEWIGETNPEPAADALGNAVRSMKRPLIYAGFGAAGATELLRELAERLEAPVATTFTGKGVFPESHPLFLWPGFGDAAPAFVRDVVKQCDGTIAIGCRFGEVATGSYGMTPPTPLVHIDIDPAALNRNFKSDLAVPLDAKRALTAVLAKLPETRPQNAELRAQIRRGHEGVWRDWEKQEQGRVAPPRLLRALQHHFGPQAIFTADSGNGLFLGMECLRFDAPRQFLAPVDFSCMGYAIPAAIGAKLGRPEKPVVALAGDGALLMTGLEMITAATLQLPIVVVVLRDRELAQIAQFQQTALSRKTSSELGDYDASALFHALGVQTLRLDRNEDIESCLRDAGRIVASGKPVVIDVAIDYSQKTHFTKGVVKTNLLRLPWNDRLRFIGRALFRKLRP
ncbi:MAG TPA: thiamine pyrophosphate-binding protein, partial [Longimicrobiales bacterium]